MKNLNEISFQVYQQPITNTTPTRLITLDWMIQLTQKPPTEIVDIFTQIADAERSGNMALKAKLKQTHLLYFTPCVEVTSKRNYASIVRFTGLLVLDFDHVGNAADLKTFLFRENKCLIAAWLSPSKRGVKALVKIPVVETIEQFKEYYYGIAKEMSIYNGFDPTGQNAVLPLFQSYDPELLVRSDFDTWMTKGEKKNDFALSPITQLPSIEPTDEDKQTIIKIINSGFNNITNTGHPALRSLCLAIGGYVGAGYITEIDAMAQISHRIETHPYLCKGVLDYKKTAQWSLRTGQTKPLMLNNGYHG